MDAATLLAGAGIAFCLAVLTVPAGVSGAVLLVPVQISILGVANPAVTPTNLLYNVIATPGGIAGYARQPGTEWALAKTLLFGAVPGVVLGSILRVEVFSGPEAFNGVMVAVLLPLGAYLLLTEAPAEAGEPRVSPRSRGVAGIAFAVGVVGGIYGIGGGAVLAPVLVGLGFAVSRVAPAALVATLVTSAAGVATFLLLSVFEEGAIAPEWALGVAMGVGGLLGGFLGASLQHRVPELLIRRLLGLLSVGLAVRYGLELA